MTTSSSSESHFDLHVIGLGYVNRVREVKPRKGKPFLACNISALNGPSNDVEYRYYDVTVVGHDAQRLIRKCKEPVEADCKVLIGFKLGDPWLDIFKYKEGHPKAGQTGVSQKARLLSIYWMNIDGDRVYTAESKANNGAGANNAPANPPVPSDAPAPDSSEADAEAPAMAASA